MQYYYPHFTDKEAKLEAGKKSAEGPKASSFRVRVSKGLFKLLHFITNHIFYNVPLILYRRVGTPCLTAYSQKGPLTIWPWLASGNLDFEGSLPFPVKSGSLCLSAQILLLRLNLHSFGESGILASERERLTSPQ